MNAIRHAAAVAALALALPWAATPAQAQSYEDTLKDIEATFGKVPGFMKQYPHSALPGAWSAYKGLEMQDTAIPAKYKALISLAVSAQIPCEYCVWMDTKSARSAGASDEEIGEAVAVAGMTRQWSTIFHGFQVPLEQFKRDVGGDAK